MYTHLLVYLKPIECSLLLSSHALESQQCRSHALPQSGLSGGDFRRKWDAEEYEERARKRIRMAEEAEEEGQRGVVKVAQGDFLRGEDSLLSFKD